MLLLCFITGQYIAFFHQHKGNIHAFSYQTTKSSSQQTLSEKCSICDQMHHTQMALFSHAMPAVVVTVTETQYDRQHDYKGIALILAAGRGPPFAFSC